MNMDILFKAIEQERKDMNDIDMPLRLIRMETFNKVYSGTPTHIGEIEVQYSTKGWRAIYGYDADGNVYIYAD